MPFAKFGIPLDPIAGRDVVIQPKLGYRFRVRFLQFGGLESASYSFDAMQQVVSVTRPKIEFANKKLGTYSGHVTVTNKPIFEPITVTFKDDIANTLGAALGSQLQKQYDFLNGRYAFSSGGSKFTMVIETLDGMNPMRARDAFRLENCIVTNIDFGEMNYTDNNPISVTMTIAYDYLGGYYSERYGIDKATHLLWHTMSHPNAYATVPATPFNGNEPDLVDTIVSKVKGLF